MEYYSDDPTTCGSCFVTSGTVQDAFTVQAAGAPEPANLALTGIGLFLTAMGARRRRRAN